MSNREHEHALREAIHGLQDAAEFVVILRQQNRRVKVIGFGAEPAPLISAGAAVVAAEEPRS
jgi:hypothetical protein